jgi:hypothetical protein
MNQLVGRVITVAVTVAHFISIDAFAGDCALIFFFWATIELVGAVFAVLDAVADQGVVDAAVVATLELPVATCRTPDLV